MMQPAPPVTRLPEKIMPQKTFYCFLAAAALCALIILPGGCSKKDEQQTGEKGRIEKMTDQAAEAVEKKIRTPMDKARATQNLGDDRLEQMDKALQKQ
jgi:hypothetical protein